MSFQWSSPVFLPFCFEVQPIGLQLFILGALAADRDACKWVAGKADTV